MSNDLGKLNDILFAEMERLQAAPKDEIAAEAERAKQIRDLGATIISNARTVMDAARMRNSALEATGESVYVPKMLGGGQ